MRGAVAATMVLASRVALACPACASGQRGFSPLHFILLALPFVVAFFAVRAILRALDD